MKKNLLIYGLFLGINGLSGMDDLQRTLLGYMSDPDEDAQYALAASRHYSLNEPTEGSGSDIDIGSMSEPDNAPALEAPVQPQNEPFIQSQNIDSYEFSDLQDSDIEIDTDVPDLVVGAVEKKKFSCSRCLFTNDDVYYVRFHERLHDNPMAFGCVQCNKPFSSPFNLWAHQQSFHKQVKFICDACKRPFTTKASAVRHYASIHFKTRYP